MSLLLSQIHVKILHTEKLVLHCTHTHFSWGANGERGQAAKWDQAPAHFIEPPPYCTVRSCTGLSHVHCMFQLTWNLAHL